MVDAVCWANNSTLAYPQGSESEDNSHSDMVTVSDSENGTPRESEDSSSDSGSWSQMIQPLTRARKGMTLRTCIVDLLKFSSYSDLIVWGSLFFLIQPCQPSFFLLSLAVSCLGKWTAVQITSSWQKLKRVIFTVAGVARWLEEQAICGIKMLWNWKVNWSFSHHGCNPCRHDRLLWQTPSWTTAGFRLLRLWGILVRSQGALSTQ